MDPQELTPQQRRTRDAFERGIAIAAPLLDVLLRAGERISRLAEPTDHGYYPVRSPDESA